MICKTDELGIMQPLKFKILGKNGDTQIYEILRVIKADLEKLAGNKMMKFECEIRLNEKPKLCEIKYELDTCKWILFKM
jgi:hypothetical protein